MITAPPANPTPAKNYFRRLFPAATVITVVGVLFFFNPDAGELPGCPFFRLTNWYCPGCGTARALHALLHGDFTGFLTRNRLLAPALCYLALLAAKVPFTRHPAVLRAVPAVIILYGLLRNLPWEPFLRLAPY